MRERGTFEWGKGGFFIARCVNIRGFCFLGSGSKGKISFALLASGLRLSCLEMTGQGVSCPRREKKTHKGEDRMCKYMCVYVYV
jgi:hypothetical protein